MGYSRDILLPWWEEVGRRGIKKIERASLELIISLPWREEKKGRGEFLNVSPDFMFSSALP
jgi:hypothetical protein